MPTSPRLAFDLAIEGATTRGSLRRWCGSALFIVATITMVLPGSAHAEDGILTWIIQSISADEDGSVIPASAMQVPQAGTALATGQQISTSAGQHMVLVNGRDLVEVRPNTTFTVGDNDSTTPEANLDLLTGTIHVEVGKRAPGQTFSIGAPYLVATVKGTQFDVSTSSEASAVSVTEGVVGVSSLASGQSIDVPAGRTAIVGRRTLGAPSLAPTPAGGAPSSIGAGDTIDSQSANTGGNDNGNGGSGGSGSGGSNSGGSGGSDSGGSKSGGLGDAVGGTADAVGGAVSGATGAVGDAVGGPVGGAVSGVGGAVGGAVGRVGGAVGGLLGGNDR